ncbi:hypothetical protein CPB86DRAFT_760391 [Serendipita vermifera]|nr:hypothetical protein CPB86DRAFT_760391 [Serendipita vermifera]
MVSVDPKRIIKATPLPSPSAPLQLSSNRKMKEPVGLSFLFPLVPVLNAISIVLLLSIFPAFLKTKVFTLVASVVLLILGNFFILLNMLIWRSNIRDIPIYSDFMIHWDLIYAHVLYFNFTCLTKFVWYMSRPGSALFLYDNRRRINRVDAMILSGAVLVFLPLNVLCLSGRYSSLEDFGPWPTSYYDMKRILVQPVPLMVLAIISIVFNALTLRNNIIRKRKQRNEDARIQSNSHINKHLLLAATSSLTMLFGAIWAFYPLARDSLAHISDREAFPYLFIPVSEVMKTIHQKMFVTRFILDIQPDSKRGLAGFVFTLPLTGMYIFCFFGIGKEARKMHQDNFKTILRLLHWGRQTADEQDRGTEMKPSSQDSYFLKWLPLLNRNADPFITVTPLELPPPVSFLPDMGSKPKLGIARNVHPPQVDTSFPSASSMRKARHHNPSPSSTSATREDYEQEPYIVLLQAPPPAYASRPSKTSR